ncbi:MAG: hypothetical protein WCR72_16525 [Bacteroidota bacterium]
MSAIVDKFTGLYRKESRDVGYGMVDLLLGKYRANKVQHGSNLNPFWVSNPFFAAPANGYDLIVGQERIIYGDALVNLPVPVPEDITVTYTCDIGTQTGNNLVITPTISNIGDHALSILVEKGTKVIGTFTTNLKVTDLEPKAALKVLLVGDSTVENGIDEITTAINTSLTGTTITYVGKQTSPLGIKHEGHGGYTWWIFAGTAPSPFRKAGAINVAAYFTDNAISIPDIVSFRLGINDMFGQLDKGYSEAELNAAIDLIVGLAKNLVDGFIADTTSKIIIELPGICRNSVEGWNGAYDESIYNQNMYVEFIHRYWGAMITQFDAYNARVTVNATPIFLDRLAGYPEIQGVHFSSAGNAQIGAGLACKINKLIDSLYGVELVANNRFASDTIWAKNAGLTIANNKCAFNVAYTYSSMLDQTISLTNGKTYRTKYEIADYVSGTLRIEIGTSADYNNGALLSGNGVKVEIIPLTKANPNKVQFRDWNVAPVLSLKQVSVCEVL